MVAAGTFETIVEKNVQTIYGSELTVPMLEMGVKNIQHHRHNEVVTLSTYTFICADDRVVSDI